MEGRWGKGLVPADELLVHRASAAPVRTFVCQRKSLMGTREEPSDKGGIALLWGLQRIFGFCYVNTSAQRSYDGSVLLRVCSHLPLLESKARKCPDHLGRRFLLLPLGSIGGGARR